MEKNKSTKFDMLEQTAHDLILRHGLRRISIEEICRVAGVSKMTFYKYFSNKIDLAKYLLQKYFDEAYQHYDQIKAEAVSYPEKVRKIIELKRWQAQQLNNEFFTDLMHGTFPELTRFMDEERKKAIDITMRDFAEAQRNGDIRSDIKPEFILYMLNHLIDMAKDDRLNSIYNRHEDLINEIIQFLFYGILSDKYDAQ